MRQESKDVKSQSKVVGEAIYNIYDNVAEAVDAKGEATILELINSQERTNEMNKVRQAAVGKPSKTALMQKALAMITGDEFVAVAGDQNALQNLIAKKVAELEAKAAAEAPPAPEETETEDENGD